MKLFIWTLIEINTVLLIAIGVTCYFLYRQKQSNNTPPKDSQTDDEPSSTKSQEASLDDLVVKQLNYAAQNLLSAKNQADEKRVTLTKLWGTLLNAERRILSEEQTEPVLQRFLSPILKAIFDSKNSKESVTGLEEKLEALIAQTNESDTTLEVKEELEKVQDSLRKTLIDEIDHLEKAAAKLRIKVQEQTKLTASLAKAQQHYEKLKQELQAIETDEVSNTLLNEAIFSLAPVASRPSPAQHNAVKQIKKLTQLYERQKNVIELLKNQMDSAKADNSDSSMDETGELAVARLERLVQESDMLIEQLENELANAELENTELKTNIETKSIELVKITEQLAASKKSAIGSLKEQNQTKQTAVADLKSTLQNNQTTPQIIEFVQQQADEISKIERLLQESETCVALLEQELSTAKSSNDELLETIKQAEQQIPVISTDNQADYEQQQQQRETLLSEHSQIKEQLLSLSTTDNEALLRSEYNKKNLEFDRLQLALIDLEKKHIKLLSKQKDDQQAAE